MVSAAASPWDAVLAECRLEGAAALVATLEAAEVPVPIVGEELDGGVMAELAWHATKVAVVDAKAAAVDVGALRAAGWHVLVAPVVPGDVIAALRGGA